MNPTEMYEKVVLNFPGMWPQNSNHNWISLYDGLGANIERISHLLSKHIHSEEVVVVIHAEPGIGFLLPKNEVVNLIANYFLKADIQASDPEFNCIVDISKIGVGTGWKQPELKKGIS
ncbi:MAG: hypothetical protein IPN42_04620 [Methylococcaceae bacterium]|nr:hypothetical protein [Methylococcaceae bacterium]